VKLLQEIIDQAVDEKAPIGTLLRRCLVFEQKIKNEKFRQWLDWELDGYSKNEDLPNYRKFRCVNKGIFLGMTARLADQPIPMHILSEADRQVVEFLELRQPVASYDGRPKPNEDALIMWPQWLVTKYQDQFFEDGDLILNRAWQEIPGSVLVGLLDQVRTRVLRFSLEMKNEIGETDDFKALPAPVVERSVVNNFYGGNVIIAEHAGSISLITSIQVDRGSTRQLEDALLALGLERSSIEDMKKALTEDSANGPPTLGQKTLKWATDGATYVTKEGLKVGIELAKAEVRRWLLQYTGWSG
jgi:hypothetical protein